MDRRKVRISFYGWCYMATRAEVLGSLDYQYEGTEIGLSVSGVYDIYSNDDGDYFAVKENDNDN